MGEILGGVGAKPHQAGREQAADLPQVRREVEVMLTGLLDSSGLTHRFGGLDRLPIAD